MSSKQSSAIHFYKICAFLGSIIILADVGFSWMRIQSFENSVAEVFESMVTTQMEIDGLRQESVHIEKVLQLTKDKTDKADKTKVDDVEYSDYEIERLKNEYANIKLYIQEKQLDLVALSSEKKHVMNEVRILFLGALIFLVLGTLLAAFGYLAWYFKIELFEDRRKKPR